MSSTESATPTMMRFAVLLLAATLHFAGQHAAQIAVTAGGLLIGYMLLLHTAKTFEKQITEAMDEKVLKSANTIDDEVTIVIEAIEEDMTTVRANVRQCQDNIYIMNASVESSMDGLTKQIADQFAEIKAAINSRFKCMTTELQSHGLSKDSLAQCFAELEAFTNNTIDSKINKMKQELASEVVAAVEEKLNKCSTETLGKRQRM